MRNLHFDLIIAKQLAESLDNFHKDQIEEYFEVVLYFDVIILK